MPRITKVFRGGKLIKLIREEVEVGQPPQRRRSKRAQPLKPRRIKRAQEQMTEDEILERFGGLIWRGIVALTEDLDCLADMLEQAATDRLWQQFLALDYEARFAWIDAQREAGLSRGDIARQLGRDPKSLTTTLSYMRIALAKKAAVTDDTV